jgi:uncharacterized protein YdiU (UPF0061 family)
MAGWRATTCSGRRTRLIPDEAQLHEGLALYAETFRDGWQKALAQKLGLASLDRPGDDALVSELFEALGEQETDFTIFFRRLAVPTLDSLRPAFYADDAKHERMAAWLEKYASRARDESGRIERMSAANPKYVFRNYLAQQAIDALADGDASVMERLMKVLERPYDEQPEHGDLSARRPEWARHKAGCSALSCSS